MDIANAYEQLLNHLKELSNPEYLNTLRQNFVSEPLHRKQSDLFNCFARRDDDRCKDEWDVVTRHRYKKCVKLESLGWTPATAAVRAREEDVLADECRRHIEEAHTKFNAVDQLLERCVPQLFRQLPRWSTICEDDPCETAINMRLLYCDVLAQAYSTQNPGSPPKSNRRQPHKIDAAILVVIRNPELSDTAIADQVGCHKSLLSRSEEYQRYAAGSRLIQAKKTSTTKSFRDCRTGDRDFIDPKAADDFEAVNHRLDAAALATVAKSTLEMQVDRI